MPAGSHRGDVRKLYGGILVSLDAHQKVVEPNQNSTPHTSRFGSDKLSKFWLWTPVDVDCRTKSRRDLKFCTFVLWLFGYRPVKKKMAEKIFKAGKNRKNVISRKRLTFTTSFLPKGSKSIRGTTFPPPTWSALNGPVTVKPFDVQRSNLTWRWSLTSVVGKKIVDVKISKQWSYVIHGRREPVNSYRRPWIIYEHLKKTT